MAELILKTKITDVIQRAFDKAKSDIESIVLNQLNTDLNSNKTASGGEQPKKKAITKRIYAKLGYDANNWMRASGSSTEINIKELVNSIVFTPKDGEGYLKGKLKDQAKAWFILTDATRKKIVNILKTKISEELK